MRRHPRRDTAPLPRAARAAARGVPARASAGHAAHAAGGVPTASRREPVELSASRARSRRASTGRRRRQRAGRPSGQLLPRPARGRRMRSISADDGPGGMFQRFPLFERLISWTHAARGRRARDAGVRAPRPEQPRRATSPSSALLCPEEIAEGHRRPSRDEMVAAMRVFAERAPVPVRYGCSWESTRLEDDAFVLVTSDGEYRCRAAVLAIGMTRAVGAADPGPRARAALRERRQRRPDRYRDRRVVIVGKRNSAFEIGRGDHPSGRPRADARLAAVARPRDGSRARRSGPGT